MSKSHSFCFAMVELRKWISRRFRMFCETTALHGWRYVVQTSCYSWDTMFWVLILAAVNITGISFIITNTNQYLDAQIQTTIESTTTSLAEVFFPAVTICNINQVEASMLIQMGAYNNMSLEDAIYRQFMDGGVVTAQQMELLDSLSWLKKHNLTHGDKSFWYIARQPCEEFFIDLEFLKRITWRNMSSTLGPETVATDFGSCCLITPQISLEKRPENLSRGEIIHEKIRKGANNGESNGISFLIDIESYNFGYHESVIEGVRLAVHDHRLVPIMLHNSILIHPGKQTHIVVTPSLYYTSDDALKNMKSTGRQCYEDSEVNLTFFGYQYGYHYDMSNCILNAAIDKILPICNCTPTTMPLRVRGLPYCTGTGITCFQNIGNSMGEEGVNNVVDPIRKIKIEDKVPCLMRCSGQVNHIQLSSSVYPQTKTFIFRQSFCELANKLLKKTCVSAKRQFLENDYPGVCDMIQKRAGVIEDCSKWPSKFFESPSNSTTTFNRTNFNLSTEDQKFVDLIYKYASKNCARIKVMIRDPYVQKIKRDISTTLTSFIANTGGLLGLCLGFSAVSLAEIVYHFLLKKY